MTLTLGQGPLSADPPQETNYELAGPAHKLLMHPFPRRVRAVFAGATVLDSRKAMLLQETAILPQLYVPESDLDSTLLEPSDHSTYCPFKGDASYRSMRVRDRAAENAVWAYPQPLEASAWLEGYAGVYWDRMDAWYDEDEEIAGHPRDPYHRVDVRQASRHVRVLAGGEAIAETRRPQVLSETGLPNRLYIPPIDVRAELLSGSAKTTVCPYKGTASYWAVELDGKTLENVAFSYPDPLSDCPQIAGHLSFDHEELSVEVDGRVE